jgi:phosphohistidine phosphatase
MNTVKRILLLRHGKSDWDAGHQTDHDRPLNSRGEAAARLMGRFLAAIDELPDLVVSSSAVRALTTARLAADAGRWGCEVRVAPELYDASPAAVLEEIRAVDDGLDTVLLAGHEPTFSQLAGTLVGGAAIRLPTAALACIDVPRSRWRAVELGTGTLIWLVTPKLLAKAGFRDSD